MKVNRARKVSFGKRVEVCCLSGSTASWRVRSPAGRLRRLSLAVPTGAPPSRLRIRARPASPSDWPGRPVRRPFRRQVTDAMASLRLDGQSA
jgi:hypothetical protein